MAQSTSGCMRCGVEIPPELIQCPSCGFALGSGEAPEAWMGETIDGKYEVEEILGVGGMGMVFKARRKMIGDEVALKILFPKFMKSELQRRLFRSEAIATAALNDPHVITIFDTEIDEEYGVAYMAMEILEGFTFKELMLSEAPMAPERLYPIFIQVCDGLNAAHNSGIIHRDLKPDNLFLCKAANGGFHVKILDFGIATVMGQYHEDESNKLLGTLRYMAPEQCRGEAVSPPTDLYALGVIMYESLTRQRATGKSVEAVLYDKIKPLNEHLPKDKSISLTFEQLIMGLLSKQVEKRPQSATELKALLQGVADPLNVSLPQVQLPKMPLVNNQPHLSNFNDISHPNMPTQPNDEWSQRDLTPVLSVPDRQDHLSLGWYAVPLVLFSILLYIIYSIW